MKGLESGGIVVEMNDLASLLKLLVPGRSPRPCRKDLRDNDDEHG
jgi:hypothetical protein